MAELTAWALTTGEAGMRSQARGLALAAADDVAERVVGLRWPWSWFRAGWPGVLGAIEAGDGAPLGPPWPDLIVTCGRRAGVAGAALKAAAGGRPLLVHVQDPLADPGVFDLIVAMEHDDITGPKVLKVLTALHDLTPDRLAAAGASWTPRLAHLPRPLTGVLLGGPTKNSPFGQAEAALLLERLTTLGRATGGGAAIVASRRTPDEALAVFTAAARSDPALWVWDGAGDNPYAGVLAIADRLVVTGDSVSMISEALATPHPVEIFTATVRRRHEGFIQTLVDRGYARLFDGAESASGPRPRLDATEDAAREVRKLLAARG
ncbi:mitochondrial fission ELM1 family protein [Phenylobacterium sp.]|uniref:mitochondrial fission ELM1 family protein n=1 Tax=Phenylobacterium sp. TaxID=1871053 RepID=UPI002DF5D63F|nr:mitochondrial fission ELM1 family protein [Phenylobacterium sp.]